MILRMEKRIEGLRQFFNPYAPGVSLMGAKLKSDARRVVKEPIFVLGKGHSLSQALECLYGEAAEREALYMQSSDKTRALVKTNLMVIGSIPAEDVLQCGSPNDLGSTGCAAHNEFENAARFAVHELIERYAIWRWWAGDIRPTRLDAKWSGHAQIEDYVRHLRIGARIPRHTSFYRLGCDGPVQVAMARSEDLDGSQIAIAFAAAESLLQAARRSALELMSVELETVDLRAAILGGEEIAPNSNRGLVSLRQAALAQSHAHLFDAADCTLLADNHRICSLEALVDALSSVGLPVQLVDLSRDEINLPTYRAMFEDSNLQPRFPKGFELSPL